MLFLWSKLFFTYHIHIFSYLDIMNNKFSFKRVFYLAFHAFLNCLHSVLLFIKFCNIWENQLLEVFCKKVSFKILQNRKENARVRATFLMELHACNFAKKETPVHVFSCDFYKIFGNTFLIKYLLRKEETSNNGHDWTSIKYLNVLYHYRTQSSCNKFFLIYCKNITNFLFWSLQPKRIIQSCRNSDVYPFFFEML